MCRSSWWARRSRCTTATAWSTSRCSRSPSTRCRPATPPPSEADISELIIGGQVRVSDLALPDASRPTSTPSPRRHRQPRVFVTEEGEGARGRRGCRATAAPSRPEPRRPRRAAKRARPCAALCPVRAPGDTGGPARRRLGNPGAEFAGSLHNAGSDTVELLAERTARPCGARRVSRRAWPSSPWRDDGWPWPSDHVHDDSGSAVRSLATRVGIDEPASIVIVHDELDLPPGTVRLKAAADWPGTTGSARLQSHLHSSDFPAGAHRSGQAAQRGPGRVARAAPAAKAVRELLTASVQTAADAVERIAADGMDAAVQWCHRCRPDHERPSPRPLWRPARPGAWLPFLDAAGAPAGCPDRPADGTVAVPESAQAVVAAALAAFTQRTPLLVVTATGLDAERLGDDLSCLIAPRWTRARSPMRTRWSARWWAGHGAPAWRLCPSSG